MGENRFKMPLMENSPQDDDCNFHRTDLFLDPWGSGSYRQPWCRLTCQHCLFRLLAWWRLYGCGWPLSVA